MGEAKNATCCGEMKYMMFKIEARNSRGRARGVCFYFLCGEITILPCTRFIPRGAPPIGNAVNDFPQSSFLCDRALPLAPLRRPSRRPGKVIDI